MKEVMKIRNMPPGQEHETWNMKMKMKETPHTHERKKKEENA